MIINPRRRVFFGISVLVAGLFASTASAASPTCAAQAAKLIAAIARGEHPGFIPGDYAKSNTFRKEQFEPTATRLGTRLKQGYTISSLGELKKRGEQVALLKITLEDGGDDLLATVRFKDGKVTGFWLN